MSEWITDRPPTEEDTGPAGLVWATYDGKVDAYNYDGVFEGTPWMPITPPEPYVKPKRWRATAATGGYIVYDSTTSSEVADSIPTREAAERIAAIYEEGNAMGKHTPGPWYIGREPSDQSRHIYASLTVRNDEGDEYNPLVACTDDSEVLIDFEANACLIAAAPELLEACEGLLGLAERQGWLHVAVNAARAAIAKAKGEQP